MNVDINTALSLTLELVRIGRGVLERNAARKGQAAASMTMDKLLELARQIDAEDPHALVAEGERQITGGG